jgi:hypothetical protein
LWKLGRRNNCTCMAARNKWRRSGRPRTSAIRLPRCRFPKCPDSAVRRRSASGGMRWLVCARSVSVVCSRPASEQLSSSASKFHNQLRGRVLFFAPQFVAALPGPPLENGRSPSILDDSTSGSPNLGFRAVFHWAFCFLQTGAGPSIDNEGVTRTKQRERCVGRTAPIHRQPCRYIDNN